MPVTSEMNDLSNLATALTSAAVGGFSYGIVNNNGAIKAALNLLAQDKKVDVISSPSVMVLNNHEATIKVGDQVPIRTSQSTNLNGGANINTSPIEMLDTGVTLKVKPRVNANGVVIMEIEQKVDNVSASDSGSNIDSPTILQRHITSSVAIVNGESVVLGGLMDETHTDSNTGIPLLKDIPYLGWLFGSRSKDITKQELIVIITPRVIENKFDARKLTDEFKRKLSGIFYDKGKYKARTGETLRDYSGHPIEKGDMVE
jgi:general secretion pathway protein D